MMAASDSVRCFHCGAVVAANLDWPVEIAHVRRRMCCPGCQAVAQAIVDGGCESYYATRSEYAEGQAGKEALAPAQLQLYDQKPAGSTEGEEAVFLVEGIRCAACVWLIERRLNTLPGVRRATLNVAEEKLYLLYEAPVCKTSSVLQCLQDIGYTAYPYDAGRHSLQLQRDAKDMFRRAFVAGLSMMQVMMYAFPAYLAGPDGIDADSALLMRWASLLLTLPAVAYSAMPFYRSAWKNLRHRILGMDAPVSLGILAAFGASIVATLRGGDVYFDSVSMFIFLLLCSRYFELAARRRAAAQLERLQHALPAQAQRVAQFPEDRSTSTVAAGTLNKDDVILVGPGEIFAADGIILEGSTAIDASLLSGESRSLEKEAGDSIPGGAVNVQQAVYLRISRPSSESSLTALIKLAERAGREKPALAQWADKVAARFSSALIVLAVATFFAWQFVDPPHAWPAFIAVLVVSCPCALSLATPIALAMANSGLLKRGVLVVQPHVMEGLAKVTHVVFDKTGTITVGKPKLLHTELFANVPAATCLQFAAALEAANTHPLGKAITDAATSAGAGAKPPAITARDLHYEAGQGLHGEIGGVQYKLGSKKFVETWLAFPCPLSQDDHCTSVYLAAQDALLARFDLGDAPRDDAAMVVRNLQRQGKQVIVLSGDRQSAVQAAARLLGLGRAYGDCLPEEKLRFVQNLQKQGAVVAMVGDGINDAAVLRAADVSLAMGGGTILAQASADAVLLSGRLSAILDAMQKAYKTKAVIRQNLIWAGLYNLVAIPAAALGMLSPWISGLGMALSSALVVANALRLQGDGKARRIDTPRAPALGLQPSIETTMSTSL